MTERKRLSKLIRSIQAMGVKLKLKRDPEPEGWGAAFQVTYLLPGDRELVGGILLPKKGRGNSRLWIGTLNYTGPANLLLADVCSKRCAYLHEEELGALAGYILGMGAT